MKKIFFTTVIILSFTFLFISCSKDNDKPKIITPYTSDHDFNLNVFYLVPSDKMLLKNYQKRISGIMLYAQQWYKKEMERNGFGEKTFGLLVDKKDAKSIKIIVIKAEHKASFYPYKKGGSMADTEIDKYFRHNPSERASDHDVVFMPSATGDHGWDAGGVPFYGLGKRCYVMDYKYFDMQTWRNGTREGSRNWIGGTMHEIGHCLNLPHNKNKATDHWISLMSIGNEYFNDDPNKVHLTKASAAILNNCQVFNKKQSFEFYAKRPSNNIKSTRIFADNKNLYVRSKFYASIPVNAVIAYNDSERHFSGERESSEDNRDYDAITWVTTNIIGNDSISLVMPLVGINKEFKDAPFELRIRFCHTNGNFSSEKFKYEFKNNKPNIDINKFKK